MEKKRQQRLALVAKCESVFAPLKENAQQLQTNLQNEQYTLASSMEIFVENAPDMVKGQAVTAFAQDVSVLRNTVIETNGLCEAIT